MMTFPLLSSKMTSSSLVTTVIEGKSLNEEIKNDMCIHRYTLTQKYYTYDEGYRYIIYIFSQNIQSQLCYNNIIIYHFLELFSHTNIMNKYIHSYFFVKIWSTFNHSTDILPTAQNFEIFNILHIVPFSTVYKKIHKSV